MNNISLRASYMLCLCYFLFIQATCEDQVAIGPSPNDFTKEMRTDLGNLLRPAIANSDAFTILPHSAPYDSIYWYLQTVYEQAHSLLKADRSSSVVDRWTQDEIWKIHIVEDEDNKNAFVLPGGDLYLTTALLKSLSQSYELYYIMTFEASLMNNRHVLNRLITEYGALPLSNLINRQLSANDITAHIIAEQIADLDFETDKIVDADKKTLNQICETSIYDKEGVVSIIENIEDIVWLEHKSYNGRKAVIGEIIVEHPERCGDLRIDGKYRDYVLDLLP